MIRPSIIVTLDLKQAVAIQLALERKFGDGFRFRIVDNGSISHRVEVPGEVIQSLAKEMQMFAQGFKAGLEQAAFAARR